MDVETSHGVNLLSISQTLSISTSTSSSSIQYVDNAEFDQISNFLTNRELGTYLLNGKVEAFVSSNTEKKNTSGCIGSDKHELDKKSKKTDPKINLDCKRAMTLEANQNQQKQLMSLGLTAERRRRAYSYSVSAFPQRRAGRRRASSLGDLNEPSTQMLLIDLKTMLNEAYPDYDFGNAKLEQFRAMDIHDVMITVNRYFAEITLYDTSFLQNLWQAIDVVIDIKKCEVFSFSQDLDEEENIWSFHYFFYNKDTNVLVYLTCNATRYTYY